MSKFYVYTLSYPPELGGAVFYVGKGTGDRVGMHMIEAKQGKEGARFDVIRAILGQGYEVVKSIVQYTDDEEYAYLVERATITSYGRENLTNETGGGNGKRTALEDEFDYERTTIQLVPGLMSKLDRMRRRLGISRSAMLALIISQASE